MLALGIYARCLHSQSVGDLVIQIAGGPSTITSGMALYAAYSYGIMYITYIRQNDKILAYISLDQTIEAPANSKTQWSHIQYGHRAIYRNYIRSPHYSPSMDPRPVGLPEILRVAHVLETLNLLGPPKSMSNIIAFWALGGGAGPCSCLAFSF